jgi:O-antigen/teichoic acid export membrane protein
MEGAMSQPAISLDSAASGFGDRVRSAVLWRWGSQVLAQIITWTTTIMVVRLLDPHDYGLFAMTQAILAALNFVNGYGFASSLISAKEVDERRVGQVFGLLIIANAILATTQVLMAPLAARYYGQPEVANMLYVQALIYLTTPFIALPASLLARGLHFRTQALVNLICAVVGASVALTLAWSGYGVWALVWAPIAMFSTRALGLTLAAGRLVKPIFDFRGSRDIIGFGTAFTLSQLFWVVQSQSDIFIAGGRFSPHDLGLYSESLFLVLIFTGRFLPPLNEVAFPAYAELNNTGAPLGPAFVSGMRMIMLIATPFYVGLSLAAGPLVGTFFGPKWLAMIPIVTGLALAMPAMALQIICSPTTNALGRPGIYLFTNAAGAVIMPACFFFGIAAGPAGLVMAWQIAAPLLLAVTLAATLPAIGVRIGQMLTALLPALTGCGVMALAVWALESRIAGLSAPLQLALIAPTGAAVYVGTLGLLWPSLLRQAWTMLHKPRASAPAPAGQTTTTPNGAAA